MKTIQTFNHPRLRHVLVALGLLVASLGFSRQALAQTADQEYGKALVAVYVGGASGKLIKDWCDDRAPSLKDKNTQGFEAWRNKMGLPDIEARVNALLGNRKAAVDQSIEDKRDALFTQLDGASKDPEADCADLENILNSGLNLRTQYPNEYATIAKQPTAGGKSGAATGTGSTGTGSSTTTQTPAAKSLPVMPPFDYVQFAKLKLDPEKEPIPDEYHCYPQITGEKYATHSLTLQILPGRKYRVGVGTSVAEGSFKIDGYNLVFTSGAFASKREHFYTFDRKEGAEIWIRYLGPEENRIDFRCFQRGGVEQIQQLNFKRKDPQPGAYTCLAKDGSGRVMPSKLEILPNRRYRYNNTEGTYKANITVDFGDDSDVRFTGGQFDGSYASYKEDEAGQQEYDFGGGIKVNCLRQVTPRPNPKFGAAKAPAAPGTGGLEGRYFYGSSQSIDAYNNLPCQGICYDYLIFQKNGYVYSDDLEETEGLEDADCTRTYPSGIPVCETYSVKGNMLQIGLEKPEAFKRTKDGLEIDGEEWDVLEPLDGLKFNLAYYTQRVSGAVVGTGGLASSTDLALRKDGRFTREFNSSFSVGVTDTGTSSGNVTAAVAGYNSRSNNGSYRVYGNTIEFKYDDGRIIKLFMFLQSGRKDLTFLHIGGSIYWESKKK